MVIDHDCALSFPTQTDFVSCTILLEEFDLVDVRMRKSFSLKSSELTMYSARQQVNFPVISDFLKRDFVYFERWCTNCTSECKVHQVGVWKA